MQTLLACSPFPGAEGPGKTRNRRLYIIPRWPATSLRGRNARAFARLAPIPYEMQGTSPYEIDLQTHIRRYRLRASRTGIRPGRPDDRRGHRDRPAPCGKRAGRADRGQRVFGPAASRTSGDRAAGHDPAGAQPDRQQQHGTGFGQRVFASRAEQHRIDPHLRSPGGQLRGRHLHQPAERQQLRAFRYRPHRGAARAAGHPVRPQHDRRRRERDPEEAGRGIRRLRRTGLRPLQPGALPRQRGPADSGQPSAQALGLRHR